MKIQHVTFHSKIQVRERGSESEHLGAGQTLNHIHGDVWSHDLMMHDSL